MGPNSHPSPSKTGIDSVISQAPQPRLLGIKSLANSVSRQTQTQVIWNILFPGQKVKCIQSQCLTALMEATPFYETGRTSYSLRRNLLFLCQPITGSAEIRENAMVRENLKERKERRHRSDNCYQHLFTWSLSLTIFLSELANP